VTCDDDCCAAQVYGWEPKPFNFSGADADSEFAMEAKKALGDRMNENYVGVTCEGEVSVPLTLINRATRSSLLYFCVWIFQRKSKVLPEPFTSHRAALVSDSVALGP